MKGKDYVATFAPNIGWLVVSRADGPPPVLLITPPAPDSVAELVAKATAALLNAPDHMERTDDLPVAEIFRRSIPAYHKSIANPNAPGGKVDMYLIHDSENGAGLITLAVPHGRADIALFVAEACSAFANRREAE